ncbi:hypothetical protein PsorP6_012932 [Peronosclerospora sorghi]|uniref:Uncharacterized protein n=1 Tax=Peronosclerospora sorghi TaxID=230839 RepID=A0ACC0WHV9_9STRA|nr:hypothetical protein PsorP6_012932 [Peronosclerospora sorghi]
MDTNPVLPLQWTRPAQFLVYLVPVGGIPSHLFLSYADLLHTHSILPLRSLSRPGGYAAELSPFRGLDWTGAGFLRFRFVSTAEQVDSYDGEDVHASCRVIGALGVCHCPSITLREGLRAAHAEFEASVRRFPGLLVQKLFAFEHTFEDATARECEGLNDLVMFPVHHELEGTGESTVSLHLQVVMDTLAVNILMSLESALRSATSTAVSSGMAHTADLASVLLDVNVESKQSNVTHQSASSPLFLSRDTKVDAAFASTSSPPTRLSGSSNPSISSPLAPSVASIDSRNRRRKRQQGRREKLLGDFNVLVSCLSTAIDHYTVAIEILREEERRSGAPGDALWLAAALEGYVFCLYAEAPTKFSTELVEKASEAVAFYAKAGTTELENLFIENLGWYYASVAVATTYTTAEGKLLDTNVWTKRLLWDLLERGLMMFPDLKPQRQLEFLIETSRILEMVGHHRRVAFFLHEAASLLLTRNTPCISAYSKLLLSPSKVSKDPQRQRDLEAALVIEQLAAEQLGIQTRRDQKGEVMRWEVTSIYHRKGRNSSATTVSSDIPNSWLIIRFHVLRQLLTIARMMGDTLLVGRYCLQLLEVLTWGDSIAIPPSMEYLHSSLSPSSKKILQETLLVDHLQLPAAVLRDTTRPTERVEAGLHAKSGVYFSPPPSIDTRVKRNFINSPSATMSTAAASLSSTLTSTPRILATPRQQFSAAVNAISTKASPAFTSFSHVTMSSRLDGAEDRLLPVPSSNQNELVNAGVSGASRSKSSRSPNADNGELADKMRSKAVTEPKVVWNLRSKTEIAKIQRKVLRILESNCTALRSSEKVRLRTFLKVDKLKLRTTCNLQHPHLSRATALHMFGRKASPDQQAVKSDFFYSPFEKQKMQKAGGRESSIEGDDSDEMPAAYERSFPVLEPVELQLTLSNPIGVKMKIQEVKAWVTYSMGDDLETESGSVTKDSGVECSPCCFTIEPHQQRKSVVLKIQPLIVGTLYVRGCFIKAFNIKTSYQLDKPVRICVIGELPMVSLSLHEYRFSNDEGTARATQLFAQKTQLALFSSETRQFVLRIRSIGSRQITNYRLAINFLHRRAAKKTCVLFNNLPPPLDGSKRGFDAVYSTTDGISATEVGAKFDTQAFSLMCHQVVSSPLPLVSGDLISIPFEISLRGNYAHNELMDKDIRIEWNLVYADEGNVEENNADFSVDAIYYRESKLPVDIVSLPSLRLESVTWLPCFAEQISCKYSSQLVTTDHLYCLFVVHVVNPTETTFKFRLRCDVDDSNDIGCEAEIGRQCSRRFVVEVPRLQTLPLDQGSSSLTAMLNRQVKMEWETHFGSRGRLLCEDCHLGSIAELEEKQHELIVPPVRFRIWLPQNYVKADSEEPNREMSVVKNSRHQSTVLSHSSFFQVAHLRVPSPILQVQLFQYVSVAITIQRTDTADGIELPAHALEIELLINEEGVEGKSDYVMVSGLLKTRIQWNDGMNASTRTHEIQCMFLSEGTFRVTVRGQVLGPDMKPVGAEIWCHQPMQLCVRSKAEDHVNNI